MLPLFPVDHLSFRAGTATMVVGSALTVSFLVYRRGLHVGDVLKAAAGVPSTTCFGRCVPKVNALRKCSTVMLWSDFVS